jgi:hypothetical protein
MEFVNKREFMAYTRFDPQPVRYLWMDGRLIPSKSNKNIRRDVMKANFILMCIYRNYAAAGFSSRSLKDLVKIVQAASNMTADNVAFPKRIIYPLDFASIFEESQALTDKFVATLENFLGIQADKISLSDIWDSKPPSEANGQSLEEYMRQVNICARHLLQYCISITKYDSGSLQLLLCRLLPPV